MTPSSIFTQFFRQSAGKSWTAKSKVRKATLEATIIRADGTSVPLGVIGRYDSNPFIRAYRWLLSFFL